MKRNLPLIILILIFFGGSINHLIAQIDSFKLADYKLPELKRQGIDISFDMSGNHSNTNYIENKGTDHSNSNFANNLNGNYFLFKNKQNYQGYHNLGLRGNYTLNSSENENLSSSNSNNYDYRFYLWSENRFYFRNLFYYGITINSNFSSNKSFREYRFSENIPMDTKDVYRSSGTAYYTSIPLSIGNGRIEPIEDARQTIYLLKELKKNNRLTREPTKEEILFLSDKISEIKNERILDARLKKIYELKQLDSVLYTMNLVNESDIVYFSTLNDIWDFGGIQLRNSGYRFDFSLSPSINYSNSKNKNEFANFNLDSIYNSETEGTTKNLGYYATISFTSEQPFKQIFQSTFSGSIDYNWHKKENTSETFYPDPYKNTQESKENSVGALVSYRFGIYPSTRTDFLIGTSLNGRKRWVLPDGNEDNKREDLYYGGSCFTSLNYYFSPKFKVNFTYHFLYNRTENYDNNDSKQDFFRHYTRLTLIYSIF